MNWKGKIVKTVEDILWLVRNLGLASVFAAIAKADGADVEQICGQVRVKRLVEGYIRDLIVRGLVMASEKGYKLTEDGRRVLKSLRAVADLSEGAELHEARRRGSCLVLGCGDVGFAIAGRLKCRGAEVAIIERDADKVKQLKWLLDHTAVLGDFESPEVLRSAGIERAEAVIIAFYQIIADFALRRLELKSKP